MKDNELQSLLSALRATRRFDPAIYCEAKTILFNEYCRRSGITACVIGVSGGVDSAVTLGLLQRAAKTPNSPLKKIVCALIPLHVPEGASNQTLATDLGMLTVNALGGEAVVVDLSVAHQSLRTAVEQGLGYSGDAWAAGQLVSNIRTPGLYYLASLLTEQGTPALVVGTTNRDEGGFIGYFGKAADGLVDLQLISDLHKSEVYQLANYLGVPAEVIARAPTGDIYDGRTDEQLIGVSYDAIELYTGLRANNQHVNSPQLTKLSPGSRNAYQGIAERLETLNRQCAHKYIGGSTSAHLDVYARVVAGGWSADVSVEEVLKHTSTVKHLNAEFSLPHAVVAGIAGADHSTPPETKKIGEYGTLVRALFSADECHQLLKELEAKAWVPVGSDGMYKNYDAKVDIIGSFRATTQNAELAEVIWQRLAPCLAPVRIFDNNHMTDIGDDQVWRPVGISPVLRFIRYENDGHLIPHYDAPYRYWEGRQTLMSVVIYLNDCAAENGGATRFIRDPQSALPFDQRDFSDWHKVATAHDVEAVVTPEQGAALMFDHRVLHDGEALKAGTQKIILRTDIIFERAGSRRKSPSHHSKALGFPSATTGNAQMSLPPRMLEKIAEDPYYRRLWQRHPCPLKLKAAGFFDDQLPVGKSYAGCDDVNFLSTPFDKIIKAMGEKAERRALNGKRPLVLLTTGGFGPVHKCHVQMMDLAKSHLESLGECVLGGYLSPSHDDYVQQKCPEYMLDAHHRIYLCQQATNDSDWLMVDPWEALYCKTAVNFTVFIERLRQYLNAHIKTPQPIDIVYVFGSDNAGFSYAFLEQGPAVCVLRYGAEAELNALSADHEIQNSRNIHCVNVSPAMHKVSSSLIRQGDDSFLHEDVRSFV